MIFALTMFAVSCSKDEPIDEDPLVQVPIPMIDIAGVNYPIYHEDFQYGDHEREILDVILPHEAIIGTAVLLHGGAYVRYSKDTLYSSPKYSQVVKSLLDGGVRIVNANYKYLENVGLGNPMDSGSKLLDWVSSEYQGNIVVGGVSAGAGISLHNGLQRDDIAGIIALEMQDLDVHQWTDVFPDFDVEQVLGLSPDFQTLYDELYGDTSHDDWTLSKIMDANDPPVYVKNTSMGKYSLISLLTSAGIDNLYHNVGHAEVFAKKAEDAGIDVTTDGDLTEWVIDKLK